MEFNKNSQLFVVRIDASQLFDDPSHCIFLIFETISNVFIEKIAKSISNIFIEKISI